MFDLDDLRQIPGIEDIDESFQGSPGGFKLVFACTVNGNKNAVKVTKVADGAYFNDILLERLRRELQLLGSLSSPFLPKLGNLTIQRYRKERSTFIVYSEEFIEGADVNELIKKGAFSKPSMISKLIHDVCSAIQLYWKHKETVHRDVKTGNIRLSTSSKNFILLDPGIALIRKRTRITPTGHGSPRTDAYTSPEVINGVRSLSYRSDLFSLGIVAYESATNTHPFLRNNMTTSQLYDAILRTEPASILEQRVDVSPEINQLIMKMLNKRPHQRPNDLNEIIELTKTV